MSKVSEVAVKPREAPGSKVPEYIEDLPIGEIMRALKSIRYGSIQIIVQDSKVVQIDRTEKTRLV